MPESFDTGTSFTIKEVTGTTRRSVELTGRALPYRPITLSGTQRHEITWYPGNPQGTAQVYGAAEDETTINGKWKDRFIQESGNVGRFEQASLAGFTAGAFITPPGRQANSVDELAIFMDAMRREGQLVEVTWGSKRRQGILAKFSQEWDNLHDLAWNMTFAWISQGDQPAPSVISSTTDLANAPSAWLAFANELNAVLSAIPFEMTLTFSQSLDSDVENIQLQIQQVADTISSTVDALLDPTNAFLRLAGIMRSIQQTSESLIVLCEADVALAHFSPSSRELAGDYGDQVLAQGFLASLANVAARMRRESARQRLDYERRAHPNVVGVFKAREGQDLRDVSLAFYGTPDEWRVLLSFNNLSSSRLARGQLIFVPTIEGARAA